MNHELDHVNRLVEYHDHISAPHVLVADDLRRGRRRVRRNRGLVAGGVAILASVVAAVSLAPGDPSADGPQPADPPGLTIPLDLPKSPLDVAGLGFHVESAPDITPSQEWNLAPDHQATTVVWAGHTLFVRVHYAGTGAPDWQLNVDAQEIQRVSVHGVTGSYVEQFGKVTADDSVDFSPGACGTPPRGCDLWQSELIWEFAPGSWASIYGLTGESPPPQASILPAFLKVAEGVRSGGGLTTHVPFRVEAGLGPLPSPTEAGVGLKPVDHPPGTSGWLVSFYGEPTLQLSTNGDLCSPNAEDSDSTVEPFTFRGNQGCLHFYQGELSGVTLRVSGVDRALSNLFEDEGMDDVADLKQWLADLTVAPLDDPSAWFDLKSALGDATR